MKIEERFTGWENGKGKKNVLNSSLVSDILVLLLLMVFVLLATPSAAAEPVTVRVNAPEEIEVGASFGTTIGVNSIINLKTLHVDVDLAAYPDADFRNIQDAVNNASAYDSVIVHNGTYRETVTMDKVLSLVGEGRPTIDAKYNAKYVIGISVDDCVVKGFKCVNAKGRSEAGIIVDSKRNVIVENVCESNNLAILMVNASDNENAIDGLHGIWIDGSNNSITENEIMNCTRCGITLDGDNSTIENNTIVDCEAAIYLDGFNLRIPCGLPQGDLVKYIKKNFRCCEAASHWRNTLWSCHRDSQGEGNFLL